MQATASELKCAAMTFKIVAGLSGEKATNLLYTIACDHPRITVEQLEDLANRIGRAAHEKGRKI